MKYSKSLARVVVFTLSTFSTGSAGAAKGSGSKIASGINRFAFDLYQKLRAEKERQEKNIFFSPASISTALAMTYAGARGATALEMAKVLHFSHPQDSLPKAFAGWTASLQRNARKGRNRLTVANALWASMRVRILPGFAALMSRYYRGGLNQMDFFRAHEQCRKKINLWVEKKTQRKIKNLLAPGTVNRDTKLALTNAIYFKGMWAEKFKKKDTEDLPFTRTSKGRVTVPMMFRSARFRYKESSSHQILFLPYKGKSLSMVVILPARNVTLASIERSLSESWLEKQLSGTYVCKVNVFLPRFKTTSDFSLVPTLAAMGMRSSMGDSADFSGITGGSDLKISAVIHKALVDVNEEGTEAAAATAVLMAPTGVSRTPTFRADRPFVFMIRDDVSGAILFLGRLHDPGKSGG